MRVRQWAVVGTTMVVAWAGGAGVAQAGDEEGFPSPAICEEEIAYAATEFEGELSETCLSFDLCDLVEDPELAALPVGDGEFSPLDLCEDDEEPVVDPQGTVVLIDSECEAPKSLTFRLVATGLERDAEYIIFFESGDGFSEAEGSEEDGAVFFFTSTEEGTADEAFVIDEADGDVLISDGAFTVVYEGGTYEKQFEGEVEVPECTVDTEPVVTPPTTHPAPTTPVVTVPVAVTQPVLATTGSPVTSAALLGGGLLVAGAGALLATRRRAA